MNLKRMRDIDTLNEKSCMDMMEITIGTNKFITNLNGIDAKQMQFRTEGTCC